MSNTRFPQTLLVTMIVLCGAWLLSSCGKKEAATPASGTFASVYATIQGANCSQCHQPGGVGPDANVQLDFTSSAQAYTGLTTYNSQGQRTPTCNGIPLVQDGSPNDSYLMAVLFSDYSGNTFGHSGCTPYYTEHAQNFSLSAAEQSSIQAWISAGALNN